MARKRMIHRDIWKSYDLAKCDLWQQTLFIGLITIADDDGKLVAEESIIKGSIFPFREINEKEIVKNLKFLDKIGLIKYYKIKKSNLIEKYVKVRKWHKYQTISHPVPSKIPEPFENNSGTIPERFHHNSNPNPNPNSNPKVLEVSNQEEPVENTPDSRSGLSKEEKKNYAEGMGLEKKWNAIKEKREEEKEEEEEEFL